MFISKLYRKLQDLPNVNIVNVHGKGISFDDCVSLVGVPVGFSSGLPDLAQRNTNKYKMCMVIDIGGDNVSLVGVPAGFSPELPDASHRNTNKYVLSFLRVIFRIERL